MKHTFQLESKDRYQNTLTESLTDSRGNTRVRFAGESMCGDLSGFTHGGLQVCSVV